MPAANLIVDLGPFLELVSAWSKTIVRDKNLFILDHYLAQMAQKADQE